MAAATRHAGIPSVWLPCRSGRRGAAARRRVRLRRRRGPAARGGRGQPAELDAMVERRAGGLPLEQVVGWAEFRGLRIFVDPGVFVPRRRSEFLVDTAVSLARGAGPRVIVDLCCGTGALGLAVAVAARRRRVARRRHRPGRGRVRPAQRRAGRRPRLPGRPVRPAAAGAARPRRHPDLQRARMCPARRWRSCPRRLATTSRAARSTAAPTGSTVLRRAAARGARAGWPPAAPAGGDQRPAGAGHDAGDDRRGLTAG